MYNALSIAANAPADAASSTPGPQFSARELRSALGHFATGVTIVTTRDASGAPLGFTCNSFAALSLDPPLVSWALQTQSPSRAAFEQAGRFAVNVLTDQQQALAERFARRNSDKFDGVALQEAPHSQLPLLQGALATFECALENHQVWGDHVLFIGRIERFAQHAGEPLLFFDGKLRPSPLTN